MRHVILVAALLAAGPALAQTATSTKPAPTASAKVAAANAGVAKAANTPAVRSAKSLDCSKQADAKGLHGKPRKGFMSTCKRA